MRDWLLVWLAMVAVVWRKEAMACRRAWVRDWLLVWLAMVAAVYICNSL